MVVHNYRRQHVLNLEKKFQVKHGTAVRKLLYDGTRHESSKGIKLQKTLIRLMALMMCQNNFDEKEPRPKRAVSVKPTEFVPMRTTEDIPDCIESSASSNKINDVQGRGRYLVCKVKRQNSCAVFVKRVCVSRNEGKRVHALDYKIKRQWTLKFTWLSQFWA